MQSIELLRNNLVQSRERVLLRIEDMRDHCTVFPTPRGGGHTLWTLGHLAYIEAEVTRGFMLGQQNPLAPWKSLFDGDDVDGDVAHYPPFEEVLSTCRSMREATIDFIDSLTESDLDRRSARAPAGFEGTFGTWL